MSELPCVGAGILVVDPGPSADPVFSGRNGRPYSPLTRKKRKSSRASWHDSLPRLLKAFVLGGLPTAPYIPWRCGIRQGQVQRDREGVDWVRGHGPQARGALLAARALERHR